MTREWEQGSDAFVRGIRQRDNPYLKGTDAYEEWLTGWKYIATYDPRVVPMQADKTKVKLLGIENAKLAMKIHRQRVAMRELKESNRQYQERHERDVKLFNKLSGELNGAKEQIERLIDSRGPRPLTPYNLAPTELDKAIEDARNQVKLAYEKSVLLDELNRRK